MSTLTVGHVVGLAAALTAFTYVPNEKELLCRSPQHYLSGRYAHKNLPINLEEIASTPDQPTGWLDVSWPIRIVCSKATTAFNHFADKPLIALGLLVEKTIRGDFASSVLMAEKNLEALKEQNAVYEQELQKLAPIADLIFRITKAVEQTTGDLALENIEISEGIKLQEKQIQDITEALQTINIEAVMAALEKISTLAQKVLTNPSFIEDLSNNIERIERVEKQLDEAQASLMQAQESFQEKISRLEELMDQSETLSLEKEKVFRDIQLKAKALVKNKQSLHSSIQTKVIYDNSPQLAC